MEEKEVKCDFFSIGTITYLTDSFLRYFGTLPLKIGTIHKGRQSFSPSLQVF